jgi:hypothetical protein
VSCPSERLQLRGAGGKQRERTSRDDCFDGTIVRRPNPSARTSEVKPYRTSAGARIRQAPALFHSGPPRPDGPEAGVLGGHEDPLSPPGSQTVDNADAVRLDPARPSMRTVTEKLREHRPGAPGQAVRGGFRRIPTESRRGCDSTGPAGAAAPSSAHRADAGRCTPPGPVSRHR